VKRTILVTSGALLLALCVTVSWTKAQGQSQQGQGQSQQGQDQSQQGQEQQQKKKKGGGFFGGMKAMTGQGSQETEATRSAGVKGVGEGAKVGDVQPTAADRAKVSEMERYSIPAPELKKFDDDGHLVPKQ
jgi:hypothetical protein